MKKILATLLTFTVGILAFNLFETKQSVTSKTFTPVQKIAEVSPVQIDVPQVGNIMTEKVENLKPFFDSFGKDEYDEAGNHQGYSGWFTTDDFRGMPEVWTILLNRDNENPKNEKLVWSATVLTQNADGSSNDVDKFQSVWVKTESNALSFRTNKVRGIEYKFDGKFFKNGKDFSDDEKVLKGTLQKIVRGKEKARFTKDFAYHEPVCFH